jgi:hypothetical protein
MAAGVATARGLGAGVGALTHVCPLTLANVLTQRVPRQILQIVLAALGLAAVVLLMATVVGTGINDYTLQIRVVTQKWLSGESRLFDEAALGYYNAPWSVWLFVPTVWFSPAIGQAMVNMLNLLGVIAALHVFGQGLPFWVKALAAAPFWVFMLMLAGNLDGIVLLGFCLSWWAATQRRPWSLALGLWLATLKVVNSLPLLLFIVLLTWHWSWRDRLKALSFLLVSLALSFPAFGIDWPLRYLRSYWANPPFFFPIVTVWKLGATLGLPWLAVLAWCLFVVGVCAVALWRRGPTTATFALVMAGWMLATPYALDIHYVLLGPAFLEVARKSKAAAVTAYLATFTPILRVWYGFDIIHVDLVYPLLLWAVTLAGLRMPAAAPQTPPGQAAGAPTSVP